MSLSELTASKIVVTFPSYKLGKSTLQFYVIVLQGEEYRKQLYCDKVLANYWQLCKWSLLAYSGCRAPLQLTP